VKNGLRFAAMTESASASFVLYRVLLALLLPVSSFADGIALLPAFQVESRPCSANGLSNSIQSSTILST